MFWLKNTSCISGKDTFKGQVASIASKSATNLFVYYIEGGAAANPTTFYLDNWHKYAHYIT